MLEWRIAPRTRSPTRMQIAVLLTGAFAVIGGVHTFNRAFLWALDSLAVRHNWDVNVFSLLDGSAFEQEARAYMPSEKARLLGFSGSKSRFATGALKGTRRAEMTIIGHRNFLPLAPILGGSRKFLIVHGIEAWQRLGWWQRAGLSAVSTFLSVSDFTARTMAAANGLSQAKFVRFPNTLDPFYAAACTGEPSRASLGLPAGPQLLTVSRLDLSERYKNIDLVIRAMPAIVREVPNASYVIVGEGADRPRLQAIARELGVDERVLFMGRVSDSDLSAYYQTSDLFVLPSTKEGFGIVFLEAMYYGKACIGSHAGGIPEVIENGHTGLLVETSSPEPLAQATIRLLASGKLRSEFGTRGRERLLREFSREAFRDRLETILCR